jgi:hypothetical protein
MKVDIEEKKRDTFLRETCQTATFQISDYTRFMFMYRISRIEGAILEDTVYSLGNGQVSLNRKLQATIV